MTFLASHFRTLAFAAAGALLGLIAASSDPTPSTKAEVAKPSLPAVEAPPCEADPALGEVPACCDPRSGKGRLLAR
ncbi:hypothetical protein P12x_005758 [Tundrisphaera lichenicola]|uniref:hypothetical protein n=1 Tax=Tundrisphaera lichenicola TaxID=2029860 RepID=UPI003EBFE26B